MDVTSVKGLHRIEVRDDKVIWKRPFSKSDMQGFGSSPVGNKTIPSSDFDSHPCHEEQKTPKNRKKIEWKLSPTCRSNRADAIEKLEWYAMRWKIEMFRKILKSGCKAEIEVADNRTIGEPHLAVCILSWRIFWMTMLADLRRLRWVPP